MPGLIGKKLGMTSYLTENKEMVACTLIQAGPCYVTQVKSNQPKGSGKSDGYEAVQVGFDAKKENCTNKPMEGHFRKAGVAPLKVLKEFNFENHNYSLGDKISVEVFSEGEFIDISGVTIGKGFQGVVKRHKFAGVGGQTHGQHNRGRAPGSIGACSFPARVFKGKKMAGRMGGQKVMMENLRILKIIPEQNILVVKGSIPGAKGSYVILEN